MIPQSYPSIRTILIIAANPRGTHRLRLDEEVRAIERCLERSRRRDDFRVVQKWAATSDDLRRALLDHEPEVVHFCGHGAGRRGLLLEDEHGYAGPIPGDALKSLFGLCDHARCVLLNACYSEVQASAIGEHIECVVGMRNAIGDDAAIQYSMGFYDALGAGKSYESAHEFGCNAIELKAIPEHLTPVIRARSRREAYGTSLTQCASAPIEDLIGILDLRAAEVLSCIESIDNDRVRFARARPRNKRNKAFEVQRASDCLGLVRKIFVDLHERNKQALRSGQFVLSYELTWRMHRLIWMAGREMSDDSLCGRPGHGRSISLKTFRAGSSTDSVLVDVFPAQSPAAWCPSQVAGAPVEQPPCELATI